MPSRTLSIALLASALLVACESGPKTSDRDLTIIDHRQFDALVADPRKPTVVVDVRPARRYAEGHIPGAINIPLAQFRAADRRLTQARQVVVYAGGLDDPLSHAAAKKLLALGYANVYDYRGGMEMWLAEGRPVAAEPDTAAPTPAE